MMTWSMQVVNLVNARLKIAQNSGNICGEPYDLFGNSNYCRSNAILKYKGNTGAVVFDTEESILFGKAINRNRNQLERIHCRRDRTRC